VCPRGPSLEPPLAFACGEITEIESGPLLEYESRLM